ncbi:MAG: cation:proton antiporter [Anaerolineales bacterium]|jgi:NhaP-type Na+/H+ or K+/H+ antiporter
METGLVIFFALVVLYTVVALWLGRRSITMPFIFVFIGAITGAHALGWITFSLTASDVELFIEATLALLLFADATNLEFRDVELDAALPGRLLGIGMPLIIMLGALVAYLLVPSEGIGFAFLVAVILAPTDAALGLPIFNNPRVPVRIRRALNVESGLNDGIASPLVTLFIALTMEEIGAMHANWLVSALSEIAIGLAVGVVLGLVGGRLFKLALERNWTSESARQIGNPALALLIFTGAKYMGGNGFVAVFIGGILFGYVTRHLLHAATEFTEVSGTIFSLFVWTIFGSTLVIPLLQNFNLTAFIYALLSLTLVRMLPVAIALIRTRLRLDTILMMGWLGPRGLASVVFMIIAYEGAQESGSPAELLLAMASWTILLSVLLHGVSALPLANWYANRLSNAETSIPELEEIAEPHSFRRKAFSLSLLIPHK